MSETVRKIWRTGGSYLLWLISAALGVADMLVARTVLRAVALELGADRWSLPAIEKFGILALGIVWLALVYVCEARYEKDAAIGMDRLLRRFAWVTGFEVGFLVLANVALVLIF
jgi:hypothetical protein